jgi:hypothetical protein
MIAKERKKTTKSEEFIHELKINQKPLFPANEGHFYFTFLGVLCEPLRSLRFPVAELNAKGAEGSQRARRLSPAVVFENAIRRNRLGISRRPSDFLQGGQMRHHP